jgi:hypothetical protein
LNLSCVESHARRDASVAAVETTTPTRGPAAGAARYLNVRFKNGGIITVTEWPNREAAHDAAGRYETNKHLSLGGSGIDLEVMSVTVDASEIQPFNWCGVGSR